MLLYSHKYSLIERTKRLISRKRMFKKYSLVHLCRGRSGPAVNRTNTRNKADKFGTTFSRTLIFLGASKSATFEARAVTSRRKHLFFTAKGDALIMQRIVTKNTKTKPLVAPLAFWYDYSEAFVSVSFLRTSNSVVFWGNTKSHRMIDRFILVQIWDRGGKKTFDTNKIDLRMSPECLWSGLVWDVIWQ